MKLKYTEQSLISLEETLNFLAPKIMHEKLIEIRDGILKAAESLEENPYIGQLEPCLVHLELGHRRIIKDNYKIVYRVINQYVYVTDIFDTRQDPAKMKG